MSYTFATFPNSELKKVEDVIKNLGWSIRANRFRPELDIMIIVAPTDDYLTIMFGYRSYVEKRYDHMVITRQADKYLLEVVTKYHQALPPFTRKNCDMFLKELYNSDIDVTLYGYKYEYKCNKMIDIVI